MQTSFDRNKTLQELENISELAFNVSVPSDALRQKPLSDFTAEDLRNLISQQSSLSFLIPLALERLEVNPFARGEQHLGDLLLSVLRVKAEFWRNEPQLLWRFQEVLIKLLPILGSLQSEISNFINRDDRFNQPAA
jgi:hypothetical protein